MHYLAKQRTRNGTVERLCKSCGYWFPLEQLVANPRCSGGRRPLCYPCNRITNRGYYKPRTNRVRYPLTPERRATTTERVRARYRAFREQGMSAKEAKARA